MGKEILVLFVVFTMGSGAARVDDIPRPLGLASSPYPVTIYKMEFKTRAQSVEFCRNMGIEARAGCSRWWYRLAPPNNRFVTGWCWYAYPAGEQWAHVRQHEEDHCDTLTNWHSNSNQRRRTTMADSDALSSKRPYMGQPHTDDGERGKTLVEGLTMRDISDCFVRALFQSSGPGPLYDAAQVGDGCSLSRGDMYKVDLSSVSPVAWQQCLTCEIEKMMGIFPNIKDGEDGTPKS